MLKQVFAGTLLEGFVQTTRYRGKLDGKMQNAAKARNQSGIGCTINALA